MTGSDESQIGGPTQLISDLFINERGEVVNPRVELFTDPVKGQVWQDWSARHLPVNLFREFGILGVEKSEKWLNVVEHNIFVAAAALTVGQKLLMADVPVNLKKLIRAAIIHDASKRWDIERKISRKAEVVDKSFENVVRRFGYSKEEILAAKNTGRSSDRYIKSPSRRLQVVAELSIEANIIGYVDARTREAHIFSLEDAMKGSIAAKTRDKSFFVEYWKPYYKTVERYLQTLDPSFDPSQITDAAVFNTVVESMSVEETL